MLPTRESISAAKDTSAEPTKQLPGQLTLTAGAVGIHYQDREIKSSDKSSALKSPHIKECTDIEPCSLAADASITAGCGSLFATFRGSASKSQIDDAFSITVLGNKYPFLLIADGAFGNCNAELIKTICHDPEIIGLVSKFRDEIIDFYSTSTNLHINDLIQVAAVALVGNIEELIKQKYPSQQMTIAFAVPLEVIVENEVVRKIISFGIGNDLIYKYSPEKKEVTALKERQCFLVTETRIKNQVTTEMDLIPVEEDISEINAMIVAEAKSKEKERSPNRWVIDKTFVPFNRFEKLARGHMPVSVVDFKEGDILIATTDCVLNLVTQYNAGLNIAAAALKSEKTSLTEEERKSVQALLDKYNPPKTIASLCVGPNFEANLRSLYEETLALNNKLIQLKVCGPISLGDDLAFVRMPLTADVSWKLLANLNTFLNIASDTHYWAAIRGSMFKLPPKGIGKIQNEVLKPLGLLDDPSRSLSASEAKKIMLEIAKRAEQRAGTFLKPTPSKKRDPMTDHLYTLALIPLAQWSEHRAFKELYTHWCQWREQQKQSVKICLNVVKKIDDASLSHRLQHHS
ncbi:MAG: hypothetical protein ACYCQI_14400 [Gammaproteobacteria bacterium]